MKKNIFSLTLLFVSALAGTVAFGQVTLPNIISTDFQCTSGTTYLINGKVYVQGGATLFIDEGVTIRGVKKSTPAEASALVITRSGRIEANGSNTAPIIFTSNEMVPASGDWGGIVILGSAPLNRADTSVEGIDLPSLPNGVDVNYGGGGGGLGNPDEDKGVMRYVRIEYGGANVTPNAELNSLTLGGVGRGTLLDYIECSYGTDDAFEFFGGTVNGKHLVALATDDDSWDFDFGYTGNLQYVVSVLRASKLAYSSDPNGIESDNDNLTTANSPRTNVTISNMTTIGFEALSTSNALPFPLLNGARWRRNSSMTVRNSIFMGFPNGVRFDAGGTPGSNSAADVAKVQYNLIHGFTSAVNYNGGAAILNANNTLTTGFPTAANDAILLTDPFNVTNPNFRPLATSPAFSGANFTGFVGTPANFFATDLAGTVFPTYRGAFAPGSSNWAGTWTRFF